MKITFTFIRPFAIALLISFFAGLLFSLIRVPLPWMLGPMFGVGYAGIRGIKIKAIHGSRHVGQLVIGCALGLYFTSEVSQQLLNYGVYIVSAAFIAIVIGALGGLLLKRIAGTTAITSFFACVPGGAAEMAVLAERAGARFDQVALSHSIRVLVVVSIIPIAVTLTGAQGTSVFISPITQVSLPHLATLAVLATIGALIFMKSGIPNAWLLGPLAVSLVMTLTGHSASAVPPVLINAAQVLIGCSLGARFKPSLREESRSLLLGVLATALLTIVLSAALGLVIALLIDQSGASLILATSPGGLAEMCITAKILKLGVPLVTSFQVARLAIVVTFSLPTWKLLMFIRERFNPA